MTNGTGTITIGTRTVSGTSPTPYLIAEIGVNHENDMGRALEMIQQIAAAGGSAAKFQTYKAERLASRHSPAYWDRTKEPADSQFVLFKRFDHFGVDEYRRLASECNRVGIDFLSTPFDTQAVEMLAPLVPAFKVASADLTNVQLLEAVAAFGKPVLLSTGAATLEEVDEAIAFVQRCGAPEIGLLHCVLAYPTPPAQAHLSVIRSLAARYPGAIIGYSDHVPPDAGMVTLTTAFALGAKVIEKHYTWDKRRKGNDHYHAMDADDLEVVVRKCRLIGKLLGSSEKQVQAIEEPARRHARRSLVAARDLPAGHVLTTDDIEIKRPGTGIAPRDLANVIGRSLTRALKADEVLQRSDLR